MSAFFTITPAHADILDTIFGFFTGKPTEGAGETSEGIDPESAGLPAAVNPACPQSMIDFDLLKGYPQDCGTGRMPPSIDPAIVERSPLIGGWDVYLENHEEVRGIYLNVYDPISSGFDPRQLGLTTITGAASKLYYVDSTVDTGWHTTDILTDSEEGPIQVSASGDISIFFNDTKVSAKPDDNPNVIVGRWNTDADEGVAIWRKRLGPEFYTVRVRDAVQVGDTTEQRQYILNSEPVHITREHPIGCGAGAMRGNCPTVTMTIAGKGLDTYHVAWIDSATNMEVTWRHSCHGETVANWNSCDSIPFPFPEEVVTLDVTFTMWDGIKPGPRTLWIDGQPIPIYLDIKDYPEEEIRPDLGSLVVYNVTEKDTLEPVPAVALEEGEAYWLEATYTEKHPDQWVTVEIPMSQTSVKQVVLFRTEDETIFSSNSFRFRPFEVWGEEQ